MPASLLSVNYWSHLQPSLSIKQTSCLSILSGNVVSNIDCNGKIVEYRILIAPLLMIPHWVSTDRWLVCRNNPINCVSELLSMTLVQRIGQSPLHHSLEWPQTWVTDKALKVFQRLTTTPISTQVAFLLLHCIVPYHRYCCYWRGQLLLSSYW